MDIDSYIKTEDIYSDNGKDVETKFDTSNYELDRPLPKEKNKKVLVFVKDEISGKITKPFAALRAIKYRYLTDNENDDNKAKSTKCVS